MARVCNLLWSVRRGEKLGLIELIDESAFESSQRGLELKFFKALAAQ